MCLWKLECVPIYTRPHNNKYCIYVTRVSNIGSFLTSPIKKKYTMILSLHLFQHKIFFGNISPFYFLFIYKFQVFGMIENGLKQFTPQSFWIRDLLPPLFQIFHPPYLPHSSLSRPPPQTTVNQPHHDSTYWDLRRSVLKLCMVVRSAIEMTLPLVRSNFFFLQIYN